MEKEIPSLWKHQATIVERARPLNYFALLADPGVGKSAALITILREKFSLHKKLLPTLIVCPIVVIKNWKKEFSIWSKIDQERIFLVTGTGKEKLETIQSAPADSILVTNYETLIQPDAFIALKVFLNESASCMVLDESHRIKTFNSKRTGRAIELGEFCKYRYILTGTPILNSLEDVFSQFRFLDKGERFGRNYYSFRATYFEDKNRFMPSSKHFPDWKPRPGADVKIKSLMEPVSQYVDKASCLTLPPFVRKVIEVELGKEQKRLYEAMKRDLVAQLTLSDGTEKTSIAELAITKALRLQQIVSGHLRVEGEAGETETIILKDNPRKKALSEILEDLVDGHKVLVWAVYHANYKDIREVCEGLKIKYAELHGEIKDKDKEADRFRTDPEVRVLIGHPGSGGIGVNLVEASYMIYYSRSFSLEFDIQSEARCYRGGSDRHESITRIDLMAPGTIDELVLKALANKQQLSDKILKASIGEL